MYKVFFLSPSSQMFQSFLTIRKCVTERNCLKERILKSIRISFCHTFWDSNVIAISFNGIKFFPFMFFFQLACLYFLLDPRVTRIPRPFFHRTTRSWYTLGRPRISVRNRRILAYIPQDPSRSARLSSLTLTWSQRNYSRYQQDCRWREHYSPWPK